MSTGKNVFTLVEEISPNPTEKSKNTDNNKIVIKLSKKKSEEDDKSMNSAECSANELKSNDNKNIDLSKSVKPIVLSKKAYEKYTERLKERTMRMEAEKIYKETERLKNKYAEKNSYLHLFDNNPQFKNMLKMISNQLKYFFITGIFLNIFSSLLYFYITRRKEGLALSSFCLSISEISMCILLFIGLRLGLLNDPNLSKAFRFFVIMESLLLFTSFIINVVAGLINSDNFNKIREIKIRVIIYLIFFLMILVFVVTLKFCLNLIIESALILLRQKTEYSVLMINERNSNKNDINFNINLSTMSNNITTDALKNESANIFIIDNNKNNNKEANKEEEQYITFNYYNKFHSSVTSYRNKDYNLKKK